MRDSLSSHSSSALQLTCAQLLKHAADHKIDKIKVSILDNQGLGSDNEESNSSTNNINMVLLDSF